MEALARSQADVERRADAERTLRQIDTSPAADLDELVAQDAEARRVAAGLTREAVR